jgi:hypothetical protein
MNECWIVRKAEIGSLSLSLSLLPLYRNQPDKESKKEKKQELFLKQR